MTPPNNPSADDPNVVIPILKKQKPQLTPQQKGLAQLFNKTARSGAGTTRPGLPGIRPSGSTAALEELLDSKAPRKPGMFQQPLETPKNLNPRDQGLSFRLMLPRWFCPDCDRTNRPATGGVLNIGCCFEDRPHLRLKAGDIFASVLCQECCDSFRRQQNDPASSLVLSSATGSRSQRETNAGRRLLRIKNNIEAFIKSRILADDDSIWLIKE